MPLVQPQQQPGGPMPYGQMPHAYPGGYVDPENPLGPEVKGFDFTEQSVRKGFIRKVYAILSVSTKKHLMCTSFPNDRFSFVELQCQLLVTLVFVAALNLNEDIRHWMMHNPALLIVALIVSFATLIALMCVESLRRKTPLNFIMLGLFTVGESYLVAASTARFDPKDVSFEWSCVMWIYI